MSDLPFRTGTSWLTDDQLVLLDVLFDSHAGLHLLRADGFSEFWNLGYTHTLDDAALECNMKWMCEHGVIEEYTDDGCRFRMTESGGGALVAGAMSGLGTVLFE